MRSVSQSTTKLRRPGSLTARFRESDKVAYLLVLPYVLQFAVFTAFPIGFAIYLTFHSWNLMTPDKPFVGLDNYRYVLTVEPQFRQSLVNLARYVVIEVPGVVLLSMLFAILLNQRIKLRPLFRVIYFLPVVVGGVGTLLLFRLVLTSQGMLNSFLSWLGVRNPPRWFSDPAWAMTGFALIEIWGGFGFSTIIFLAALQNIPTVLYEAARMDGATPWQEVRHVTVPLLNPTIVLIVMVSTIGALQLFTQPYVLTGGGPEGSTRTPVIVLFWTAFTYLEMGRAATMGVLLSVIILTIALIERKVLKRPIRV